jgi:hypothetical protein
MQDISKLVPITYVAVHDKVGAFLDISPLLKSLPKKKDYSI